MSYVSVVVEALLYHVELPVLSGVVADAGAVQPVAVVAADVVVDLFGTNDNNSTMSETRFK